MFIILKKKKKFDVKKSMGRMFIYSVRHDNQQKTIIKLRFLNI